MFTRRHFLVGTALTFYAEPWALADDFDATEIVRYAESLNENQVLGPRILPPSDPAWKQANTILANAPKNTTPYWVAEYFKSSTPARFQQAWPEADANPIIVEFFYAMHDKPTGDTTPWCAAFVNWCLRNSGIQGTNSAGSQSFINTNWGREIWKKGDGRLTAAKTGDVAVFRHQSDPDRGHVAFFKAISVQPDHIDVLGGNQLKRVGGRVVHLIDFATMQTDGDLELFSIRTKDGLRH